MCALTTAVLDALTPEDLSFAAGECRAKAYEARRSLETLGTIAGGEHCDWLHARILDAEARERRFQLAMTCMHAEKPV